MKPVARFLHQAMSKTSLFILIIAASRQTIAQPLQWERASGTEGTSPFHISIYAADPDTLFANGDHLLMSTDRGEHWDSIAFGTILGVIEVDPFNSKHLIANETGTPFDGNAVRISTDCGQSWKQVFDGICHSKSGCAAPVVEFDPVDPNLTYVDVNPALVFRSSNQWATWDSFPVPIQLGLSSIAVSPSDNQIMFVGYGSPTAVFKSTDGGQTWDQLLFPISQDYTPVLLAVHPTSSETVYAGVYPYGMYKTTDGGTTWLEINNGLDLENRDVRDILINPKNPEEIFIALGDDNPFDGRSDLVYVTGDGGYGWSPFTVGLPCHGSVNSLIMDPERYRLYAAVVSSSDSVDSSGVYVFDAKIEEVGDDGPITPQVAYLYQNHPNPFNNETRVSFALEKRSRVRIKIRSLLGETITTLVDAERGVGFHTVVFNGEDVSSGIYFYTLELEGFTRTRRMVFLK